MKLTISIPVAICFLLFGIAYPMNDTDGVCGKGLFPIGPNAKSLILLHSRVDITLTKRGTLVRRTYEIKNTAKADTFTFGAIKCYNCVTEPKGDYLTIKANGKALKCNEHLSFLRDSGTVVTRRDLSLKDARQKIASLDGTIETHLWVSFRMQIQHNVTQTIEVEYLEHPVESYFTQAVVGAIYLYTEKFWAGDSVPLVEVRFRTEKNFVPVEYFIPSGESWDQTSIKPDSITHDQLIWRFHNYRPNKTMYSYTFRFLHPYAVKTDLITDAFSKATGIKVQW
jgi:hypothetical protein